MGIFKLYRLRLVQCCLFIFLFAAKNAAIADESEFGQGKELYGQFCQSCHGPDRQGLAAIGGDLATLTGRLSGDTKDMPDFTGFFSVEEIAALYAYLSAPK